jgi:hypothetical protein
MFKIGFCVVAFIAVGSLALYAHAVAPAGARGADFGYDTASWSGGATPN